MHDPSKLPVEIWAEKRDGRTRIMIKVDGDEEIEAYSWPDGFKTPRQQPSIVIPLATPPKDNN